MPKRKRKAKKTLKKITESVKIENNTLVNKEQDVQKMDEMKKIYFKESFINELCKGSYQNFLLKVEQFVEEKKKEFFSENYEGKTFILGTFKEHVIASDAYGNLKRLSLENSESGLRCNKVEEIEVKKYSKEDIEKELSSSLAEELNKTLDCEDEECDEGFKESFNHLISFSTSETAKGFVNIFK